MNVLSKPILAVLIIMLLAACNTMMASDPEQVKAAELNLKLGVGYMRSGHFEVALEKLNKAVEYDPRFAEAYNALGVLYEETGDVPAAEQNYSKAVDLDSGYALAKMNYARLLCNNGKAAEGEKLYLALLDEPKQQVASYTGAGVCARIQQSTSQAEQYFRKALELNPNAAEALLEMADLSHAQGEFLQARAFLQRYYSQVGYSPKSLWLGVSVEESLGDERLSREYARLLQSRFADSEEARRLLKTE